MLCCSHTVWAGIGYLLMHLVRKSIVMCFRTVSCSRRYVLIAIRASRVLTFSGTKGVLTDRTSVASLVKELKKGSRGKQQLQSVMC